MFTSSASTCAISYSCNDRSDPSTSHGCVSSLTYFPNDVTTTSTVDFIPGLDRSTVPPGTYTYEVQAQIDYNPSATAVNAITFNLVDQCDSIILSTSTAH